MKKKRKYTLPLPYQRGVVADIERFDGRALVALEMGLGKTITSLMWAYRNPEARPIIVVCPASLKYMWESEARRHFGMRAEVLEGRKIPEKGLVTHHSLIIINYDILGNWLEYLRSLKPKIVIADEAHYAISRTARRTRWLRQLVKGVPYFLPLSGTPLTNEPPNLWPVLNMLQPKLFPAFHTFAESYTNPELTPWGWKYKGSKNLKQLHQLLLDTCMVRRLKKDVLHELPSKRITIIPMDIEKRKEYDHAVRDFVGWLGKQSQVKANKARKAQRLVKMGYLKRLAGSLKLKYVKEWIDDFQAETGEKLIVFGLHKAVLKPLHEHYKNRSVLIDGSIKGRDRQIAIEQFLSKKRTDLLFGNIQAAGVGWSAKGVFNTAIIEYPWAPGTLTQAMDRTHGVGRGHETLGSNYFFLVARNTIEEKLCSVLQDKQGILDATLDGIEDNNSLDIFDLLSNELLLETYKGKNNGKKNG